MDTSDTPPASDSSSSSIDSALRDLLSGEVIRCKCEKCTKLSTKPWLQNTLNEFIHIVQHNMPEYLPVILNQLASEASVIIVKKK